MKTILALLILLIHGNPALAGNAAGSHMKSVDSLLISGLLEYKKFPADHSDYLQVKGYYHNHELILITTIARSGSGSTECKYYVKEFDLVGVMETTYPPVLAKMNSESRYDSKGNYDYNYHKRNALTTRIVYESGTEISMAQYGKEIRLSKKQKTTLPEAYTENFRTLVNSVALTLK